MKVQNQKHGQGGHALDFLNEPSKKPAAMQADEDMGFDEMQMRILEDTEQVGTRFTTTDGVAAVVGEVFLCIIWCVIIISIRVL